MNDYIAETYRFWEELSAEDRLAITKTRNHVTQLELVRSDEEFIKMNEDLIRTLKERIKRLVNKEDYTDKDEESVKLCLEVIKGCEDDIKYLKRDLRLLIEYPVGSQFRPSLALHKEITNE